MKSSHGKIILFFAILWVAGGCATQTSLEPASVGVTESTFDVGIGSYKGVRLIADPDSWRGIPEVTEKVTLSMLSCTWTSWRRRTELSLVAFAYPSSWLT